LRESLNAGHQGPDKAHRLKILEEGMTYQQTGIEPNAAQFLETRQFQIAEVARWFNLPLHKLREMEHSSVRANIEQEALDYVQSTLRPWLVRWEQEINRKLISPRERYIQSAEFVIDGLLRGDFASRYAGYAVGRQWGWLSVNEIRALENLNPIQDGNTYLSPMNMTPADRLNEVIDAQVKPKPAPVQAQPEAKPEDDGERQALRAQVLQQVEIIQKLQAADEAARTTIGALQAEVEEREAQAGVQVAAVTAERDEYKAEYHKVASELAKAVEAREEESVEHSRHIAILESHLEASNGHLGDEVRATDAAKSRAEKAEATIQQMADDFAALAARCEAQDKALEEAKESRQAMITAACDATEAAAQATQERDAAVIQAAAQMSKTEAADMLAQVAEARALLAETALSTEREARAAMLTSLITANRGVLIDAVGRMVRRESERARSKRTTPQKLREWAGTFYEEHELDLWSQALAPAIGVHLALCGKSDDAGQIARELAQAHMAASQQQILAVAASDPEDYHRALDLTLTRWETARAETTVDALLRQEIAHVRSI
jgi:hypothetical protein